MNLSFCSFTDASARSQVVNPEMEAVTELAFSSFITSERSDSKATLPNSEPATTAFKSASMGAQVLSHLKHRSNFAASTTWEAMSEHNSHHSSMVKPSACWNSRCCANAWSK